MKLLLLALLLIFSLHIGADAQTTSQPKNYEYKIDNRSMTFGTDFARDSIHWLRKNYYEIAFVPKNKVVTQYFHHCMMKIDEMGYIDSVFATTKISYETNQSRIYVGKAIPYEISKSILSVLSEKNEVEVIQQVEMPDFVYNTYSDNFQSRSMIIGGRSCPYDPSYKYVKQKKAIAALVKASSKEEYLRIIKNNNEEEEKYQAYLKEIDRRPKFDGCEAIQDLKDSFCSNNKLKKWIKTNLVSKYNYDDYVCIRLSIDKEGNVTDMIFLNSGKSSKKHTEEFKRIFLKMPKWLAATDPKSGWPIVGTAQIYIRFKSF